MNAIPLVDMGDFESYAGPERLREVTPDTAGLAVTWDDGYQSRFHWIWLRDHCACAECRHPATRERLFEVWATPLPLTPAEADIERGVLHLRWREPDGGEHVSLFDPAWLRRRAYDPMSRAGRERQRQSWGAEMAERLPTFKYEKVRQDKEVLAAWADSLLWEGAALIRGAPAQAGELERFVDSVAPIYETHFGRIFDVQSKPNPNNAAYTSLPLEPHVDLPNHWAPPDIQLLFCIVNEAEGGDSTLVDGLKVTNDLRREVPEAFHILSSRPIDFRFQDEEVDIRCRVPVIELHSDGSFAGMRFNNWIRDSLDLPEEDVEAFYKAYQELWRALRDPENCVKLRLDAGDILAFDNRRVLHGRTGFTSSGSRHLQGCYLQRSMLESRLRLLQRGSL